MSLHVITDSWVPLLIMQQRNMKHQHGEQGTATTTTTTRFKARDQNQQGIGRWGRRDRRGEIRRGGLHCVRTSVSYSQWYEIHQNRSLQYRYRHDVLKRCLHCNYDRFYPKKEHSVDNYNLLINHRLQQPPEVSQKLPNVPIIEDVVSFESRALLYFLILMRWDSRIDRNLRLILHKIDVRQPESSIYCWRS